MPKIGQVKLIIAKKIANEAHVPLIKVLKLLIQFEFDKKKTLRYLSGGRV